MVRVISRGGYNLQFIIINDPFLGILCLMTVYCEQTLKKKKQNETEFKIFHEEIFPPLVEEVMWVLCWLDSGKYTDGVYFLYCVFGDKMLM